MLKQFEVYVGREDRGWSRKPDEGLPFTAKESFYTAPFSHIAQRRHIVRSGEFGVYCGDVVIRENCGRFHCDGKLVGRIEAISDYADALVIEDLPTPLKHIIDEQV